MELVQPNRQRIGDLLVSAGTITIGQLTTALIEQKKTGEKLGRILVNLGFVSEKQKVDALRLQLGLQSVDISKRPVSPEVVKLVPEVLCRRHVVFPVALAQDRLMLAMEDPVDIFAIDDVRVISGYEVVPMVASSKDILEAIGRNYAAKDSVMEAIKDFKPQELGISDEYDFQSDSQDFYDEGPVVRFVNLILEQAVRDRASDVHIEPLEKSVRVRYRIDGLLRDATTAVRAMHASIVSRVKIMCNLDIAERRLPQDGRVRIIVDGREVDLRVSTLPTIHGEKIVIRLLDKSSVLVQLSQLGFPGQALERYKALIKQNQGLVLVTGPTGSGKTTTLYASLNELNMMEKNIMTLEDPVEYRLDGIAQVQVNPRIGLSFANGLRSFLRQDPDIIMVGEIRDSETASIAVESALTGHMVLSTLHTNDAVGTVLRLVDMGVEPFLVASALSVVLAQRLVRTVCPNCKTTYQFTEDEAQGFDPAFILKLKHSLPLALAKGTGCQTCGYSGYYGRTGVYEMLVLNPEVRDLIAQGSGIDLIRKAAASTGMLTLWDDGVQKVISGQTTIEELVRAIFTYV